MKVFQCVAYISMPHQALNNKQVDPLLKQVRCKTMPECMGGIMLFNMCSPVTCFLANLAYSRTPKMCPFAPGAFK